MCGISWNVLVNLPSFRCLQTVVGGDEPFEAFMKKYLADFAHSTVSSEQFK